MTRLKRIICLLLCGAALFGAACRTDLLKQTQPASASAVPAFIPVEGDVVFERFPDYDTGTDADWSYQSNTLRIAIRQYRDPEARQTYYVADIRIRSLRSFGAGFANGRFNSGGEDAEAFSVRENAVLAINGSYNTGLVVHYGEEYQAPCDRQDAAVLLLYRDGSMEALPLGSYDPEAARQKGLIHAWQFGPLLVHGGQPNAEQPSGTFGIRHSRILFGYYEPGHYVAVAVDGRRKDAIGMDTEDMVGLMMKLGCKEAINLDGGCSAIMTFMGETVNRPPKVRAGETDVNGRMLVDMLLFAEYDAEGNAPELGSLAAKRPQQTEKGKE